MQEALYKGNTPRRSLDGQGRSHTGPNLISDRFARILGDVWSDHMNGQPQLIMERQFKLKVLGEQIRDLSREEAQEYL